VRAIVVNPKLALVSASAESLEALQSAADRAELSLRDVGPNGAGISATIPLFSVPDFGRAKETLESASLAGYSLEAGLSELSAIGAGIGDDLERCQRAFSALGSEPRFIVMKPRRVSAVAASAAVRAAEASWHRLFVESTEY
jgi:hypothetical protein